MAGGMVKDTLEEADLQTRNPMPQVIMVKCAGCRTLNEEHAKFCKECGKAL